MGEFQISYSDKATIYFIPDLGMGYTKIEVRSLKIWTQRYAQYENAVVAEFKRKRKHKSETILETTQTTLLAFEGWDLPNLPDPLGEPESKDGLATRKSRHTYFSDDWKKEFDEFYKDNLSEQIEIIDLRNFKIHEEEVKKSTVFEDKIGKNKYKIAEEIINSDEIFEGARKRISVNTYERNPKARQMCINEYGTACYICGIILSEKYGDIAEDYIHVHHLRPISKIGKEYKLNPIEDLRPVCPNCHSILHLKNPPLTIEEMKQILKV